MYPPEDDHPHHAKLGDRIEHKLMPCYVMTVQEAKPCEADWNRWEAHSQYKITDPEGNEDWLCAYDVKAAT